MLAVGSPHIERSITRCRLILSVVALVAVFLDPTQPALTRWWPLQGGSFNIDPHALAIMGAHLCYSLVVILVRDYRLVSIPRLSQITICCDMVFGAAIAAVTEGVTSPFYAFFAFAVVEAGLTAGLRRALMVTTGSVVLYLSLIVVSAPGTENFYLMRPVYLAIVGYLVGYLGQERLNLEAGIRELAATAERQQIARDLHDGRAQALAAISLRLETCQELLRRGRNTEALLDLSDLQTSVNREYDEFRGYMRSLVGLDSVPALRTPTPATRFSIRAQFEGSGDLLDQVLQIVREGATNVLRHAHAKVAQVCVRPAGTDLLITIDDDGVGFYNSSQQPWSISSRVEALGGHLDVRQSGRPGAHVAITLPVS